MGKETIKINAERKKIENGMKMIKNAEKKKMGI